MGKFNIETHKNQNIKGPEIFFNGESPINSFIPGKNQFFNQ